MNNFGDLTPFSTHGRHASSHEQEVPRLSVAEDWSDADRMFMEHALLVAERGRGKVSPNPLVV